LPVKWFTRWATDYVINMKHSQPDEDLIFNFHRNLTRKYKAKTGNPYLFLGDEFHPDIKMVHFTHSMNKPHNWKYYSEFV